MFDLRILQCFEALMTERNVSRAATRLGLTQSAMSHALARLRRLFDDPLLIKSKGQMMPTERALQLRSRVHELLAEAEELLLKPAPFDPATARAKFTVMSAEYVEYLLAPALMRHLAAAAPGMDVEFRAADREHALSSLERGQIDFRLGWWPEPPQTLRYKLLFRDRLVCVTRRNHPGANGSMSAEQYIGAQHARIELPRTGVSNQAVDRAAAAFHRRLRVALRVQSSLALSNVVANSDLVATVPERFGRALAAKFPLQVMPLPFNVPDVRMALYWHERTHKQVPHRWFRQTLVDLAKTL